MGSRAKIVSVDRSVLEATAYVIGPESAAARALAYAATHEGKAASFFRCGTVIVVRIDGTNHQCICN